MNPAPTLIALALAVLMTAPAMAAPDTRAPTDAELKTFDAWYQKQFPDSHAGAPVFSVVRADPKGQWHIGAALDAPPRRGVGALCRMQRTEFSFAGRWSAGAQPRNYAWLERPACSKPAQAVELLQQMPDVDVLGLLERQAALLHSARILLGGNTACASQRSFRFTLAQLTVGSAGPSPEVMAGLVFKSDHDTQATVWARRSGIDYNVWNVSCP